jgi:hypothetical protein
MKDKAPLATLLGLITGALLPREAGPRPKKRRSKLYGEARQEKKKRQRLAREAGQRSGSRRSRRRRKRR